MHRHEQPPNPSSDSLGTAASFSFELSAKENVGDRMETVHREIWRRFIDKHNVIMRL